MTLFKHVAHSSAGPGGWITFGILLLSAALFTLLPTLKSGRLLTGRVGWWAAALSGLLVLLPAMDIFEELAGSAILGLVPLLFAAIALFGAQRVQAIGRSEAVSDHTVRPPDGRLALFCALAITFVTLAIPIQLDKQWVTIGWALQGAGLLALWRKLPHPGLKYAGLGLLSIVTLRLVANPELLTYYPRESVPVFNWLAYTYLVPMATLLAGAAILKKAELDRVSSNEKELYSSGKPLGAIACVAAAIVIGFVWINLTIFDAFGDGRYLEIRLGVDSAQDLALSAAWGVYGLILLSFGIGKKSTRLRQVSLGLLALTSLKVFLFDLRHLVGLYRVAAFVGLAVAMTAVSLGYQRFVLRSNRSEEESP